jgi:hypothetical protein
VLLLQLLEPGQEPCPLAARDRDLGGLEATTQFGPGSVDHRTGQRGLSDRGQDRRLEEVGW